jgi:hypothetical protein
MQLKLFVVRADHFTNPAFEMGTIENRLHTS